MKRIVLFVALVGATFGGCRCGEDLQVLAPKIEIGDPFDATHKICQKNFIEDCAFDFGTVGIGREKKFTFAIRNPTNVDLNITSITIDPPNAHFKLDGAPPTVIFAAQGSIGKNVTVVYAPETETAEHATVIIKSDAENVAKGKDVEIDLKASGKDLGCPQLTITPASCDFGAVGVGSQGQCQVSLMNSGSQDLEIDNLDISPADGTFAGKGVFILPTIIAPGTAVTAAFEATPTSATTLSGTLTVTSNDCQNPTQTVPLTVEGAQTPTAVARVKSINGVPNSSQTPPVQPLDDVVVSGDQSTPGTAGASIVGYQWSIVSKPSDSQLTMTTPTSVDTGFQFDADGIHNGLDVAGTYVIGLVVTDSNGAKSANTATVTLNAVPLQGLHVELTWAASQDDIDLHVFKGSSPGWCSATDCDWEDCKGGGPSWDSTSGQSAGDPSLDVDDLCGFGPENINVDAPVNGSYVIGVDAYGAGSSDTGPCGNGNFLATDVEVKVFLGGALAGQFTNHFSSEKQFWTVARVDVNGASSVVEINQMGTADTFADFCL